MPTVFLNPSNRLLPNLTDNLYALPDLSVCPRSLYPSRSRRDGRVLHWNKYENALHGDDHGNYAAGHATGFNHD